MIIVALCIIAIALAVSSATVNTVSLIRLRRASGGAVTSSPFLSPTLSHPARGFALVSLPRTGLVSPSRPGGQHR